MPSNPVANSTPAPAGVTYFGRLKYDDSSDIINFRTFIRRAEGIVFSAVTTWGTWGLWNISAVAESRGAIYRTEDATCRQGVGPPQRCCVEFTLLKVVGTGLYVKGLWSESGEEYKFTGRLRKR